MLETASLGWRDGQPYSATYRDIYHAADGAGEVRRVFLAPAGFADLLERGRLLVGELGFGTGLNFAVAAEACLQARVPLHFVSVDQNPLHPDDFDQLARTRWAELPIYRELAAMYPPALPGWQQRSLADGQITLTLYWGAAATGLAELRASQRRPFDLWLLDGFAPDRNPQMWTDELFADIAAVSRHGTRVTTFTAAGRVRRGLTAAGFAMQRVDQRPHKRESLAGTFTREGLEDRPAPANVHVVGAGIAGASTARHLAEAGVNVTVHDAQGIAAGASGIPATTLHGRLLGSWSPQAGWRARAYLYAASFCRRVGAATEVARRTGALQVTSPTYGSDRLAQVDHLYGATGRWVGLLDPAAASDRAGIQLQEPALWFPGACVLDTPGLCRVMLDHPGIEVRAEAPIHGWLDGPTVLAGGISSRNFSGAEYLELAAVAGQVDILQPTAVPLQELSVALVGNGYVAPFDGSLVAGATYEYRDWPAGEATRSNLENVARLVGSGFTWGGCARAVRCVSSDRIPVAGLLHDAADAPIANAYVNTGHGSMGMVSSHLCAAIVCAAIIGQQPPVSPAEAALIAPGRFRARQRRRGYKLGARL